MTEDDGRITRKYRELAGEEPPAVIDAAILAASRRAVKSRPASQRWAGPVSIAAVLVLAVGVVINVQHEQPGIETSEPARRVVVPEAPQKPDAALQAPKDIATPAPAPQSAPATASTPPSAYVPRLREEKTLRRDAAAPSPLRKEKSSPAAPAPLQEETRLQMAPGSAAPAAAAPAPAADALRAEPRPFAESNVAVATVPVPAPVPAERFSAAPAAAAPPVAARTAPTGTIASAARVAPEMRAKKETADSGASAQKSAGIALADPVAELERIARLRSDGRHEEADKAIAEFRRKYPDYRIPDPVWERVKPR
jgi:hypothetical protein